MGNTSCRKKKGELSSVSGQNFQPGEHDYLVGPAGDFTYKDEQGKMGSRPNFLKKVKITDSCSVLVHNKILPNGQVIYTSTGSQCTHFGADLSAGVIKDGRIHCPWHGACFNLETGDIEEFPGLDSLPTFPCHAFGDQIYVHVEPAAIIRYGPMKSLARCKKASNVIVILGSGPAGYMCAQTLRQHNFDGKLIMVTADKHLPYDRTFLSKALGSEWENIKLREKSFFEENDIQVMLDSQVKSLDLVRRTLTIEGKEREPLKYETIFLAIGKSCSRLLDSRIPGHDLKNVAYLYNMEQSAFIAKSSVGKQVVLYGSSFIAMELANSLSSKAVKITIVSQSAVPFDKLFGVTVGGFVLKQLQSSFPNVEFIASDEIASLAGNEGGAVKSVTTRKGKVVPCDLLVVAIGSTPDTSFITKCEQLKLDPVHGSIVVNKYMQTGVPNTYAGGDCCSYPLEICGGKYSPNIGHWQVALTHGKVAAINMLAKSSKSRKGAKMEDVSAHVPFFWSSAAGLNMHYCGYCESFDEVLIFGSMDSLQFCAVYRSAKRIRAILGVGSDPLITAISVELNSEPLSSGKVEFPDCLKQRYPNPPQIYKS